MNTDKAASSVEDARHSYDLLGKITSTRGQSNLGKAASNALHTLHAQDSAAISVSEICMRLQNLKVDHVTPL